MFKVLIIDDDFPVRMLFKQIIDWEALGFEIVGEAVDGIEGLAMVETLEPQVILLDMEMPRLNGIQVIEQLMEKNYKCKIIVISCHDDFDYVKQALKLGAMDYLLKTTINEEKLRDILAIVKQEHLKREKDQKQSSKLKRLANKGLQTMKHEYIRDLITGGNILARDYAKSIENMNLKLSISKNMMVLLQIDDYNKQLLKIGSKKDHHLFEFTVSNIIEEVMAHCMHGELCVVDRRYVLLFNAEKYISEKKVMETIMSTVKEIKDSLSRYLDLTATLMIMDNFCTMKNLHGQYIMGIKALDISFYEGLNKIYIHSQMEHRTVEQSPLSISKIKDAIEEKDLEKVNTHVHKYLNRAEKVRLDDRVLKVQLTDILSSLESQWSIKQLNIDAIDTMYTFHEIKDYVLQTLNNIEKSSDNTHNNKTVQLVMDYCAKHYGEDISLGILCQDIHMNLSYVSHLFKQEQGISFTEYLKNIRINKAKTLLTTTDLKLHAIAKRVGIHNYKYFAKLFKKQVGVTPTEYRTQKK